MNTSSSWKIIGIIIIIIAAGLVIGAAMNQSSDQNTVGNGDVMSTTTDNSAASNGSNNGSTNGQTGQTSQTGQTGQTQSGGSSATTVKTYAMTEVAKHNSRSSCWTAVNGGVYDVTTWINKHPGGQQAILSLCGKDGSSAFNQQHGGQARPEQTLASFKIGVLTK